MSDLSEKALTTLHQWVQSESLRKHCYAVADCMQHFAREQGADPDLWTAVGLLHDFDYEKYPTVSGEEGHPYNGARWLRDHGWSEEVCRAVLSHAHYAGVPRQSPLEKTLFAVDELSGFVTAVALVRPSKSIHDVEVSSVKKKMKDKAFARAVSRDDIHQGAAELPLPLERLISEVIVALKNDAARLGLAGTSPASSC